MSKKNKRYTRDNFSAARVLESLTLEELSDLEVHRLLHEACHFIIRLEDKFNECKFEVKKIVEKR